MLAAYHADISFPALLHPEFEKRLQYGAARFYSSEAANKVPEVILTGKREFENTGIHAQVGGLVVVASIGGKSMAK